MVKVLRESNEIKTIPIECIKGATLLSADEAENLLTQEERKCEYQEEICWWWLRSPGDVHFLAAFVFYNGSTYRWGHDTNDSRGCVRPALIISNIQSSNLQIGDVFELGEHKFKVISREYALCEEPVGQCMFREDCEVRGANVYEKSDVKKFVDNWFNMFMQDIKDISQGIKTDDMIADEMDLGF